MGASPGRDSNMKTKICTILTTAVLLCVPLIAQSDTISHEHTKGPFPDGPSVTQKYLGCHGDKSCLDWKALGYDKDPMIGL